MLIKVFGIWLMTNNINHLYPSRNNEECRILMNMSDRTKYSSIEIPVSCEIVAQEINKQIKEAK